MSVTVITKAQFVAMLESGELEWPPIVVGTSVYGIKHTLGQDFKWQVFSATV